MYLFTEKTAGDWLKIGDMNDKVEFKKEWNKTEKIILLQMSAPNYPEIKKTYQHFKDVAIIVLILKPFTSLFDV